MLYLTSLYANVCICANYKNESHNMINLGVDTKIKFVCEVLRKNWRFSGLMLII